MIFSPLEQFEIFPNSFYIFQSSLVTKDFFLFSNLDFSFLVSLIELLNLKWFLLESKFVFPNFSYFFLESVFLVALSMLVSMVGKNAQANLGIVLTLFFFILILNVLGLIPFGFCVTSQIIVTQFLGFFAIGGLTLKGIQNLGFNFLNLFVPRNVPIVMLPFLSVIEIISFISRTLSLSIRLFANMVAGHALLHILMGALLSIFSINFASVLLLIVFFLPALLIFAIMLLEMGIAFLQAYVFVVLFLIYLNDSYKSH